MASMLENMNHKMEAQPDKRGQLASRYVLYR